MRHVYAVKFRGSNWRQRVTILCHYRIWHSIVWWTGTDVSETRAALIFRTSTGVPALCPSKGTDMLLTFINRDFSNFLHESFHWEAGSCSVTPEMHNTLRWPIVYCLPQQEFPILRILSQISPLNVHDSSWRSNLMLFSLLPLRLALAVLLPSLLLKFCTHFYTFPWLPRLLYKQMPTSDINIWGHTEVQKTATESSLANSQKINK